jgi:hypothetical protein
MGRERVVFKSGQSDPSLSPYRVEQAYIGKGKPREEGKDGSWYV